MAIINQYWIVRGEVTDSDAHDRAVIGQTEWQFSDGPAGERGSSADFTSLREGLEWADGAIIHTAEIGEAEWSPVPDADVLHVWECEETGDQVEVSPTFYQESGTPVGENGEDMVYVRTLVRI